MESSHHFSALQMRSRIADGEVPPDLFRRTVEAIPRRDRDTWFDLVLGVQGIPDDGPGLPPGCVPYFPSPVDALMRAASCAELGRDDVFVDVGSGVGRALAFVHLLTGAPAIGLEIQSELASLSRRVLQGLGPMPIDVIEGDAVELLRSIVRGSVFLLYCPFGSCHLGRAVDQLEGIARQRELRLCCVHLTLPFRPWLREMAKPSQELLVYRSTFVP